MANNVISNSMILNSSIVIEGAQQKDLIEKLAESFTLEDNKKFKLLSIKMVEESVPSFEDKKEYISLLKKALAWDLAFSGKFDGELAGWSLMACGVIPKAYEGFKKFADDIAIFAKAYVNYYAAMKK